MGIESLTAFILVAYIIAPVSASVLADEVNQEYNVLEQEHLRVKNEAESLEKEIEDKIARKIKIECAIKAYKHSNFVTEFSEELWTGLLDKCLVYDDHIEFRWKYIQKLSKIR